MLSCGAAGRGVFSLATAVHHSPTHVGKDVAGRSIPSPLGGTLGEKILCTLHSCSHSTLFTFLLRVQFEKFLGFEFGLMSLPGAN